MGITPFAPRFCHEFITGTPFYFNRQQMADRGCGIIGKLPIITGSMMRLTVTGQGVNQQVRNWNRMLL